MPSNTAKSPKTNTTRRRKTTTAPPPSSPLPIIAKTHTTPPRACLPAETLKLVAWTTVCHPPPVRLYRLPRQAAEAAEFLFPLLPTRVAEPLLCPRPRGGHQVSREGRVVSELRLVGISTSRFRFLDYSLACQLQSMVASRFAHFFIELTQCPESVHTNTPRDVVEQWRCVS